MNDELRQEITDEVTAQLRAFLADVVETWEQSGDIAAMRHGHLDPGRAICAGFGDVLREAIERRDSALNV